MANRQEMARRELARRELARREEKRNSPKEKKNTFLEDVGSIGARGLNTFAFGIPGAIGNKVSPELTQEILSPPTSFGGKMSDVATQLAAFLGGGAGKLGMGATKATTKGIANVVGKDFSKGLTSRVISGGVGGGVASGSQITDPSADFEEFVRRQSLQGAGGALTGSALGALAPIGKGLANIKNVTNTSKAAKIQRDIRGTFYNVKKQAVNRFGKQLDDLVEANPNNKVDIDDFIEDLKFDIGEMSPTSRNVVRGSPKIRALLKDGSKESSEITVKELQKVINDIDSKIPKNKKTVHLDALDRINDLRAKQLEAFPEMANIRQEYAKTIEPYNNVKNFFKFNKVFKAIESDFQGAEGKEAVEALLPPDVIKQMGGIREAQKILSTSGELVRNLIIGISSGVGAGVVFRKLNEGD